MKFLFIVYFSINPLYFVNNQPSISQVFRMNIDSQEINYVSENNIQIQINEQLFEGHVIYNYKYWNSSPIELENYEYIVTSEPIIILETFLDIFYNFKITNIPITGVSFQVPVTSGLPNLMTEFPFIGDMLYPNDFNSELFLVRYTNHSFLFGGFAVTIWSLNPIIKKTYAKAVSKGLSKKCEMIAIKEICEKHDAKI